jgi:hypothetical protein
VGVVGVKDCWMKRDLGEASLCQVEASVALGQYYKVLDGAADGIEHLQGPAVQVSDATDLIPWTSSNSWIRYNLKDARPSW